MIHNKQRAFYLVLLGANHVAGLEDHMMNVCDDTPGVNRKALADPCIGAYSFGGALAWPQGL